MASKRSLILLDLGAVATPLLLVLAARSLMSPAPSKGDAPQSPYNSAAPAAVVPVVQHKLSPEQELALQWISAIGSRTGLVSPMAHPTLAVVAPKPEESAVEPAPEPAPRASPVNGLKLTGIVGTSEGGLAAVNGKVYKVGDAVRPGIKLIRIDARSNKIVLQADDGTEFTIRRKQ